MCELRYKHQCLYDNVGFAIIYFILEKVISINNEGRAFLYFQNNDYNEVEVDTKDYPDFSIF